MYLFTALIFFFVVISIPCFDSILKNVTIDDLRNIQENIQKSSLAYCHGQHSATKHKFSHRSWESYLGDSLAIVYPFCLKTNELGNRLGNYFNELACAEIIGVNFITVHKQWDLAGSFLNSQSNPNDTSTVEPLVFLKALPEFIVNNQSTSTTFEMASSKIETECKCTQYCWQDKNAPWVKAIPSIKKYLSNAVLEYYNYKGVFVDKIEANDLSNAKPSDILPIIPDVAIQYRCGDNLGFNWMYGILPFYVFPKRIPITSKYIYVLTDHPARSSNSPYAPRCELIIKSLFDYLAMNFPNAIILVKRGGDMFLDYARLIFAKVTICSASTYCLWPALANNGTVYFPLSYLVAGADTVDLAVNITSNFNWITEAEIISNFNKVRPWTKIIDVLIGNEPMPK